MNQPNHTQAMTRLQARQADIKLKPLISAIKPSIVLFKSLNSAQYHYHHSALGLSKIYYQ